MSAERIRELNDAFRTTMTGGRVMLTAGVDALPSDVKAMVIRRVAPLGGDSAETGHTSGGNQKALGDVG